MQQRQPRYRDHADGGAVLARSLVKYAGQNVVVFGVGLDGVAVAAPIADALGADLDVLVVRTLTLPGQPDRPWGAVAALGDCVQVAADPDTDGWQHISGESTTLPTGDLIEMRRLEDFLRGGRPPEPVSGRLVIIVTDGLASVPAMRAAARVVRRHHPARLVTALPAGTGHLCRELRKDTDEVVCPSSLGPFRAIGPVYAEHSGISPGNVRCLLSVASPLLQAKTASRELPGRTG